MSGKQPFEYHRFSAVIILRAVRMYLRYPLSYQDTADRGCCTGELRSQFN